MWTSQLAPRYSRSPSHDTDVHDDLAQRRSGRETGQCIGDVLKRLDVDFRGVANGTKAFLPHVIASGDGHIVNISSVFGLIALPGQSAYNAAKFAVRGFTEALRQEMLINEHPVKVTCVHPGGIKTAVARNATVADGENQQTFAEFFDKRLAIHSPKMAAERIVRGVRDGRARVVIGWEAKALDLLARILGPSYQRIVATAVAKFFPWGGTPRQQAREEARTR
jgi:short-subunit dehydrogenase